LENLKKQSIIDVNIYLTQTIQDGDPVQLQAAYEEMTRQPGGSRIPKTISKSLGYFLFSHCTCTHSFYQTCSCTIRLVCRQVSLKCANRYNMNIRYLLRHAASNLGVEIRSDGYAPLSKILQAPDFRGKYTVEQVMATVWFDTKQRFFCLRKTKLKYRDDVIIDDLLIVLPQSQQTY